MNRNALAEIYRRKLTTPEAIAGQIGNGWQLVTDNSMGSPQRLKQLLGERLAQEKDFLIRVHTLLDIGVSPFYGKSLGKKSWSILVFGTKRQRGYCQGTG